MNQLNLKQLQSLLDAKDVNILKEKLKNISDGIDVNEKELQILSGKKETTVNRSYFLGEIKQILNTRTIQRSHYYLKRLIRSITEVKTSRINDINLNRWKEYDDLITDSLWIFDKRDQSGAHKAEYWGNFVPQIPNQFIRRYTKKGEWVLDPFLGSGTTLIECKRLGRNGIGIEINNEVIKLAKKFIGKEKNPYDVKTKVINGDSSLVNIDDELKNAGVKKVQLIIMHPPYWDIIKFGRNKSDLSNAETVDKFLEMFGKVVDNTVSHLEDGRYLTVVIGDKYADGEWIPLGFYVMQEVMKRGLKLKSTIVKNFETTRGKMNRKELWRYRALAGGFYIFKHEYIFLFQKG